jgi:hypothetical protein
MPWVARLASRAHAVDRIDSHVPSTRRFGVPMLFPARALVAIFVAASMAGCSDTTSTAPTREPGLEPLLSANSQSGLQLRIGAFGDGTKAAWKSGEGLIDAKGSRFQALLLQKATLTSTFSAAYAQVKGLEGLAPAALVRLRWEHRNDTHCGAGAPRWNVNITGATGSSYTVFLGCSGSAQSAGSAPSWTRDSWEGPAIAAEVLSQAGTDAANGTITSIFILFDEGNDIGSGFVFLDNITVNSKVFTSSSD